MAAHCFKLCKTHLGLLPSPPADHFLAHATGTASDSARTLDPVSLFKFLYLALFPHGPMAPSTRAPTSLRPAKKPLVPLSAPAPSAPTERPPRFDVVLPRKFQGSTEVGEGVSVKWNQPSSPSEGQVGLTE